ncbi:MAG: hypothetical protein DRQ10_06240, partial [Candidatus Hydrothermota bacterium]
MERFVIKRDGRRVRFDRERIASAIFKAARAVGGRDRKTAEFLAGMVEWMVNERFYSKGLTPSVEDIQDIVEKILIEQGHAKVAKAYILYRQKRAEARELESIFVDGIKLVDEYIDRSDWRVAENSNMTYSLQGLNFYLASSVVARYWLNKIYPPEIKNAHDSGDFHIHDLGILGVYTYYGKEVVVARRGDEIWLTSFERLYESIDRDEVLLSEEDDAWAKYPDDLYVLDRDGWTRVTRLVRKRKDRKMVKIKVEGREVVVTEDHPMIIGELADRDIVQAGEIVPNKHKILLINVSKFENLSQRFPELWRKFTGGEDVIEDKWSEVGDKIPVNIPDEYIYDITTESHTIVVNGMWNHNCVGWDLEDLLRVGFGGVRGKIESKPAKHFRVALGQIVNFFYTLQGEAAGAQAFSVHPNETVIIRDKNGIKIVKIGEFVDSLIAEKSQIKPNGVEYRDTSDLDFEVLSFTDDGRTVWKKLKAVIRHKVTDPLRRVKTNRGILHVSNGHSVFSLEKHIYLGPKEFAVWKELVSAGELSGKEFTKIARQNGVRAPKKLLRGFKDKGLVEVVQDRKQPDGSYIMIRPKFSNRLVLKKTAEIGSSAKETKQSFAPNLAVVSSVKLP